MKKKYVIFFLFCISFFSVRLYAQGWLWARGNTGGGIDGWPIATDPSGNVFVAGFTLGGGPVVLGSNAIPVSLGFYQCILAKYNPTGNVLWAISTNISDSSGETFPIGIATDIFGNVFFLGSFISSSLSLGSFTLHNTSSTYQYFIAKIDASGTVLWALNAGNVEMDYSPLGNIAYALGNGGIATDPAGNVYITANFNAPSITIGSYTLVNTDASGVSDDILIAKYNTSGDLVWAKSAGGAGNDDAYGITVTPAGDVYIAGMLGTSSLTFGSSILTNSSGNPVALIARFDASGSPVWAAVSGGTGNDYAIGVAADASNNVYLTGGFKEPAIAFNGTTISNPTPGNSVLFLAKFNAANNISWSKTIFDPSVSDSINSIGTWGFSIAMSPCGPIWVSGSMSPYSTDSINISGHILHAPLGAVDPVFIAGYDPNGNYVGSGALSSGADDQNGIACDALGNVYMCADYFGSNLFIAGNDTLGDGGSGNDNEFLYVTKFNSLNSDSISFQHAYTTLCGTQQTILNGPTGYNDYYWSNGRYGSIDTVSDTGLYFVYASVNCTSLGIDSFMVVNADCDCSKGLFMPNAFTPNGDGQDDVFYPRGNSSLSLIKSFRVYDRWGELLFQRENIAPNDASNAWDGAYKGKPPRPDVFIWVVDGVCENGSTFNKKGDVTIIK